MAELLDAHRAAGVLKTFEASDIDVVVIAQSMATPPAVTVDLLEEIGARPVVVWALRSQRGLGDLGEDFDHSHVTAHGATVGVPMLTSVLVRTGRPFDLISSSLDDADLNDVLEGAIRAAASAAAMQRARLARVGKPIDGYVCVDLDAERLSEAIGTTVVSVEPAAYRQAVQQIHDEELRKALNALPNSHAVDDSVTTNELELAVRCKLALKQLVRDYDLDAGAFNCHVPEIRLGPDIAIAPCYALGCSTTAGIPWTCAGDVVTAVAMLAVKALGVPALYHELQAFDSDSGVFVVANTGETDLGLAGPEQVPVLAPNPWYPGPPRSLCTRLNVPAGPATLVGFAQLDVEPGHRFIVAHGVFTDAAFASTGTTNAGFAFAGANAGDAWRSWCLAGANHHGVLAAGDISRALESLGRHLGVEVVHV